MATQNSRAFYLKKAFETAIYLQRQLDKLNEIDSQHGWEEALS